MTEQQIRKILNDVQSGSLSVDKGLEKLRYLPFEDVGFARIDHHRTLRQGFPEVILDRKSTRLNSSHIQKSRMPSSA